MLQPIINYANDAAGIEKTLRGLQGFVTIAIGLLAQARQEDVEVLVKLRAQFALGRRYFRFLKWHPCWQNALRAASTDSITSDHNDNSKAPHHSKARDHPKQTLEVLKFAFLGMYFFLEMFTITNALNITTYSWGPKVQLEANKCWFYSISISIVLCFYDYWIVRPLPEVSAPSSSSASSNQDQELRPAKSTKATEKTDDVLSASSTPPPRGPWSMDQQSKTQLIVDCADLIVPGAAVGWISVGPVTVGIASTISTVITGRQIWGRVQREARQKQQIKQE